MRYLWAGVGAGVGLALALAAVMLGIARMLSERGLTVSVRKSRGRDIRAACGQLIVDGQKRSPGQQLAVMM